MEHVRISYKAADASGPPRGSLERTLPSGWQDLTPEQAWYCMNILMRGLPRRQLVEYLLQLPAWIQAQLDPAHLYELLRCITWMEIDPLSPVPIASYIESEGQRLYLPTARLEYSTCREYMMLDTLWEEYHAGQGELHDIETRLIALLLRPAGYSPYAAADPRVIIRSEAELAPWLPAVRALSESTRVYVITLIGALRRDVYETYHDYLFTDTPPSIIAEEDPSEQAPATDGLNLGWMGAYLDVAADGIFGTYDQVLDALFHEVCAHMMRKVDETRRRRIDQDHAALRARM